MQRIVYREVFEGDVEILITIPQLKKTLRDLSHDQSCTLMVDIAQSCPQAKQFLTVRFESPENITVVLEQYKQKIQKEFFPKRGYGRLNLREAKKAISEFRRICTDKAMGIDLMLFYVENCVEFTRQFGDINENFYISAANVYKSAVKEINSGDLTLYNHFAVRLRSAVDNACDGWGFQDDLSDLYSEIVWIDEDEI